MSPAFGLDFGTTNSAIAVADDAGVRLARFGAAGSSTFRSVLFFDADERGADNKPLSVAGPDAIDRYFAADGEGRLILSTKSHLASRTLRGTQIFSSAYTLEALVGLIARELRVGAEAQLGGQAARVVVGRPVRFAGASSPEDDTYAVGRLRAALVHAGFDEEMLVFEQEPVAAAYHYESRLDEDQLVLIADFGGGTSDFCLLRIGPDARRRGDRDILGVDGVALAGDAFDGRMLRHLVAPELGRGATYVVQGKTMPVPPWLFTHLERWHHLTFLKTRENLTLLERVRDGAEGAARARLGAFERVVRDDLGYQLYRAVERTKVELSTRTHATFRFDDPRIEKTVSRAELESWIRPELEAIAACVDRLLAGSGVAPAQVDRVFMTGGSSFVPAVRRLFASRFGDHKLQGGDELISIASGLALRARDLAS
jgi:hypothetical chaperone protein